MTRTIDRAFGEAVEEGVFPAADLLVAKGGEVLLASQYGAARAGTCFDVSSLTKPVAAATLTAILAAEGLVRLADTTYQWLPGARNANHKRMTVRGLLDHTSGLPAWQPFYREIPGDLVGKEAGKAMILDSCLAEPLAAEPGSKVIYSDIGFVILGELLEQAGRATLDGLFAERVARPLSLSDTFFVRVSGMRPADTPRAEREAEGRRGAQRAEGERRRFAPTEDCPWRGRIIRGEVHDQNAFAMGGIAGHAGLFSTAADLHRFTVEFVKAIRGESSWIPAGILGELAKEEGTRPAGEKFVLGWNRPSRRNSAAGRHFSPASIGHLGYTGCSIWIDLKQDFWIILLTNRIHPSTMNQKIRAFRPMIHDLIHDELLRKA